MDNTAFSDLLAASEAFASSVFCREAVTLARRESAFELIFCERSRSALLHNHQMALPYSQVLLADGKLLI